MRALAVLQPYADLIVQGKKTVELRSWKTSFRGEFLVHASKGILRPDLEHFGYVKSGEPLDIGLGFGCIVGKATLEAVWQYRTRDEFENDKYLHLAEVYADEEFSPPSDKLYAFLVKDAVKFETPIPCRGMLNFFRVGPEIERLLPK